MVWLHGMMLSWIFMVPKQTSIPTKVVVFWHTFVASGKVNIHLPSQHNYIPHGNFGQDRHQRTGGSIANINADGTFTHVVADDNDGDY